MFTATDSQYKTLSNPGLIQEARNRLKERGGRMTVQRLLVLKALVEISDHSKADELHEIVKKRFPKLRLSTIYRTLDWLEEDGLLEPQVFEKERSEEHFDPMNHPDHFHFMCLSCNQLIELDNALVKTIKAQFESSTGAQVQNGSVSFYGICAKCQ